MNQKERDEEKCVLEIKKEDKKEEEGNLFFAILVFDLVIAFSFNFFFITSHLDNLWSFWLGVFLLNCFPAFTIALFIRKKVVAWFCIIIKCVTMALAFEFLLNDIKCVDTLAYELDRTRRLFLEKDDQIFELIAAEVDAVMPYFYETQPTGFAIRAIMFGIWFGKLHITQIIKFIPDANLSFSFECPCCLRSTIGLCANEM